jgi:DNA-binding NtrC family response regulator
MAKTVLIIDDDAPTRGLLTAVMARAGLAAVVASNGGVAIDIIKSHDDLCCIVLDLMMPIVDGPAVLAHLSSIKSTVPVIVCTAVGPRQSPEFDPAIVRAVVQKPFDVDQLTAMVQRLSGVTDAL